MPTPFLQIATPHELAHFFGLTYEELGKLVYGVPDTYRYSEFLLPKKAGGYRTIRVPCRRLKAVQRILKDALYEVHSPRASAHGFARGKSVATNAHAHLDRAYIFNVDLEGYFDSIHFGRVLGLFMAAPCNFPRNVAVVLAQICCFRDSLPQGAPTSPIVANMVTRKLDRQLEDLARSFKANYTRYADDITFSFNSSRHHLPQAIVESADGQVVPGRVLVRLIEENGFAINYDKVRLAGSSQRKAVTGVTVNQFCNVRREFIKQTKSQLHAWKAFDYEAAEREYNERYDKRHRGSDSPKSLMAVILGRMAYLKSIRGSDDAVYIRLAREYNELVGDKGPQILLDAPDGPAPSGALGSNEKGLVILPGQGYENLLAVYGLVRSATTYLYWYERHMERKVLEILRGELQPNVDVRLLSGRVKADQLPQLKQDFKAFRKQVEKQHGISVQWRVWDEASPPHARFIMTDTGAWNVPPLNTILRGDLDEILPSTQGPGDFEGLWSQGIDLNNCSAGGKGTC